MQLLELQKKVKQATADAQRAEAEIAAIQSKQHDVCTRTMTSYDLLPLTCLGHSSRLKRTRRSSSASTSSSSAAKQPQSLSSTSSSGQRCGHALTIIFASLSHCRSLCQLPLFLSHCPLLQALDTTLHYQGLTKHMEALLSHKAKCKYDHADKYQEQIEKQMQNMQKLRGVAQYLSNENPELRSMLLPIQAMIESKLEKIEHVPAAAGKAL